MVIAKRATGPGDPKGTAWVRVRSIGYVSRPVTYRIIPGTCRVTVTIILILKQQLVRERGVGLLDDDQYSNSRQPNSQTMQV